MNDSSKGCDQEENLGEFVLQVIESVFGSGVGEIFISALMDVGKWETLVTFALVCYGFNMVF